MNVLDGTIFWALLYAVRFDSVLESVIVGAKRSRSFPSSLLDDSCNGIICTPSMDEVSSAGTGGSLFVMHHSKRPDETRYNIEKCKDPQACEPTSSKMI